MANYLIRFRHKLPAEKDFNIKTEIVWISTDEQQRQGEDYKDMLLTEKLKIDGKQIVLIDELSRL